MDLAVIIVSWNVRELLDGCLTSVFESLSQSAAATGGGALSAAIWVVDNRSADGTAEMVTGRFPQVRLRLNDANCGFAQANNQAIEEAMSEQPRYLLLLNPDTEVRGRALETMVGFMDLTPPAGLAGARLVFGDGSFQHSAFRFPGLVQLIMELYRVPSRLYESGLNGRYPRRLYQPDAPPFPVDHTLGAAMLVRRPVVESVGLLDSAYFMYCEEIDWARRIRAAGWELYCVPAAEIVHYAAKSSSQVQPEALVHLWRSRHRLYTRHLTGGKARLAGWLVRRAMLGRASRAESDSLCGAYLQILDIWR